MCPPASASAAIVCGIAETAYDPETVPTATPIFRAGLGLDSIDSVNLVLELETEFGVFFEDAELSVEMFGSIEELPDVVVRQDRVVNPGR